MDNDGKWRCIYFIYYIPYTEYMGHRTDTQTALYVLVIVWKRYGRNMLMENKEAPVSLGMAWDGLKQFKFIRQMMVCSLASYFVPQLIDLSLRFRPRPGPGYLSDAFEEMCQKDRSWCRVRITECTNKPEMALACSQLPFEQLAMLLAGNGSP